MTKAGATGVEPPLDTASSQASECERAPETGVDLGHQPVRQRADALLQRASVDRGDLCDVDDRVGFEAGYRLPAAKAAAAALVNP